jgi:glutamate--cysteine ligase
MGPLGYQSDAQSSLAVSFNSLRGYALSLNAGLTKPYPPYEAIGLREGERYRQLATTLLQIENEFYSTIRPKPRFHSGERPLYGLTERGVDYIEVRCMDCDPFSSIGVAADTMRFLDMFLLHCLLHESPPDTPAEIAAMSRNQHDVAQRGREPHLRLIRAGAEIVLGEWARELLEEFEPIAAALDGAHSGSAYQAALAAARAAVADSTLTRSARVLAEIDQSEDRSYIGFALAQSRRHKRTLTELPLASEVQAHYARMAEESLAAQRRMEATDRVSFETYRQQYLSQDLLGGALLRLSD